MNANTSTAVIIIGLVKVSPTDIKSTFVGFDHDLSNKSILTGDYMTFLDLPNGYVIDHLNDTSILQRYPNYLTSITQYHVFEITTHDDEKRHNGQ